MYWIYIRKEVTASEAGDRLTAAENRLKEIKQDIE